MHNNYKQALRDIDKLVGFIKSSGADFSTSSKKNLIDHYIKQVKEYQGYNDLQKTLLFETFKLAKMDFIGDQAFRYIKDLTNLVKRNIIDSNSKNPSQNIATYSPQPSRKING